jgi:hypothetical protein
VSLPRSPAAILSDLDGVLVDSGTAIEACWGAWATSHGLDPTVLHGRIHGVRSTEVIRDVAPHLDVAAEAVAVEDLVLNGPPAELLPGAVDLLTGAAGVPVAIVTSCPAPLADRPRACWSPPTASPPASPIPRATGWRPPSSASHRRPASSSRTHPPGSRRAAPRARP